MRPAHYTIGILFLFVFLATGLFMRSRFAAPAEVDVGVRLMHRSAHIYILFSALLNLVVASGYRRANVHWCRRAQSVASALLLAAPTVFTAAFFIEPAPQSLDRPIVLPAVVATLLAVLVFVAAAAFDRADV